MRNADLNTIAREFHAGRREAQMQFGVYMVLKSGKLSAKPLSTFRTEEQATERASRMMSYADNAGKTFVAKAL